MKILNNGENVLSIFFVCLFFFVFKQGGDYFKLLRFTVELRHLELLPFAQASTHIAPANAKKSKWQTFGPSNRRAEKPQGQKSKFQKHKKLYTIRSINFIPLI